VYGTFWSLVPALVAISLALITKEVYLSLFAGIVIAVSFVVFSAPNPSIGLFFDKLIKEGMIARIGDTENAGILMFLVLLGIMVSLMKEAGGSAAFGKWAQEKIKNKKQAQLCTMLFGMLLFIDDYFNCLTVGSVMKPVTEKYRVSKEKLAYMIDSTAAPVCIIAPISSWAAAVSGFVTAGENGLLLFIKAIPFNFYALLTLFFVFMVNVTGCEYGSMKRYEQLAEEGEMAHTFENPKGDGKVFDLVFPVLSLIIFCVIGLMYTGGCFNAGETFHKPILSIANTNAPVGLAMGAMAAVILTIILYTVRRVLPLNSCMDCIPDGFKAMVPAIVILTFAWTLKSTTDALGVKEYIVRIVSGSAADFAMLLPAIIFVIAGGLAFATGTSWGTFGILIPICLAVFPDVQNPLRIISMSACMAGAVFGDHCSPISDTTIMSSAGAGCKHINHVTTQMPYAVTVACVCFVCYVIAGFVKSAPTCIAAGAAIILFFFAVIKKREKKAQENCEKAEKKWKV